MGNILLSLCRIAIRFLLFLLYSPDGKCAHEQNVDECQTHIAIQNVDEEIRGEIAVVVQIISPQRHDAVAHQKRKHNERGTPTDDKPCNLFFRCGHLECPVGAHCAEDHQDHADELHPRDGKARIVHLRRPEVRHKNGCPRKTGRKTEIEINAEIDRPAAEETNTPLHSKADDTADEER